MPDHSPRRATLAMATLVASLTLSSSLASAQPTVRDALEAQRSKQLLYILVNNGYTNSYVGVYHAFAKQPKLLRKITNGISNPGAIWTDSAGNLYVGNDLTYTSSVTEYAPGTSNPSQTYSNGIDLPFGGTVDSKGTMYVSVVQAPGAPAGALAVIPPGYTYPTSYLWDYVEVPHGVSVDKRGNIFLAQIYGDQSSVLEFPAGSTKSKVLPLNELNTGAFLEDLKLDANDDIVVADAYLRSVRFYPRPYGKESMALTAGLTAPTGLAYGADGSLFVANEYINSKIGNVVVFPPGATQPSLAITSGITGGVLGVAVSPP
jgi:hypothetical protein